MAEGDGLEKLQKEFASFVTIAGKRVYEPANIACIADIASFGCSMVVVFLPNDTTEVVSLVVGIQHAARDSFTIYATACCWSTTCCNLSTNTGISR